MQIILDINDNAVADELLALLKQYRSKGVVIQNDNKNKVSYSDEQLKKDWKMILSRSLGGLADDYYKSDQYKLDRAAHSMGEYK